MGFVFFHVDLVTVDGIQNRQATQQGNGGGRCEKKKKKKKGNLQKLPSPTIRKTVKGVQEERPIPSVSVRFESEERQERCHKRQRATGIERWNRIHQKLREESLSEREHTFACDIVVIQP